MRYSTGMKHCQQVQPDSIGKYETKVLSYKGKRITILNEGSDNSWVEFGIILTTALPRRTNGRTI